jgi:exopolysaccharide/PEP-CTERM locus tyrosine autokinase
MNSIEKALQRQKEKDNAAAKVLKDSQAAAKQPESIIEKASQKAPDPVAKPKSVSAKAPALEKTSAADTEAKTAPSVAEKVAQSANTNPADFQIDLDQLEKNGHVSLRGERKQINEEYREIKRKLLKTAFGGISMTLQNPNIIMVTSARPSEGKTFTAVNLAMTIAAEQDKTVLLVDADVLKPNVLRTLGLKNRTGLMDYLLEEQTDIANVLYSTSIDKLKIIPAGKSHHLSTELLASTKMHDTIDEFAKRYSDRVVIIDTPPLIGINESAILANFAGQAVVVVEEGSSKMRDIEHAVARLNPDMAIGFVVNKSVNVDADGTGYYGYYYGADRDDA